MVSYLAALHSVSRYRRENIQELCAIQVSVVSRQIVDVYHAHAVHHNHDDWARDHIHGLSLHFLRQRNHPGVYIVDDCLRSFR